VQHVCCWAHARRKFVIAAESGDGRTEELLTLIRQLYRIERDLPPLLGSADEPGHAERRQQREEQRRLQRQRDAGPVLAQIGAWLQANRRAVLPKAPLGQAITYASNHWGALGRYLEKGILAIDNNVSERTLRAVALGRSNWGVFGNAAGGRTAAVLYSVVGTCKHLGIDPFGYLREALPGLFALGDKPTGEQLLDWLPDRWQSQRARHTIPLPAAAS
jgi:hypothetical protein